MDANQVSLGYIQLTTSITQGAANIEATFQVPSGFEFEIQDVRSFAWTKAAAGNLPKYTPLPRYTDAKGANNDIPPLALITADLTIGGRSLSFNKAVPMNLISGEGASSAGIGTGAVIQENQIVSAKFTNNTNLHVQAADVDAYIVLVGLYRKIR